MHNITRSRVRWTNVAVESKKFYTLWSCVCSLSYPACAAHAPYFIICSLSVLPNFPTLSHKRHPFRKKKKSCWTWNMCFNFLYNSCVKYLSFLAVLTFWRRNYFILAHTVYKMWTIQEPNTLELWNKLHFKEKKRRVCTMFKIFSTYVCWINI